MCCNLCPYFTWLSAVTEDAFGVVAPSSATYLGVAAHEDFSVAKPSSNTSSGVVTYDFGSGVFTRSSHVRPNFWSAYTTSIL